MAEPAAVESRPPSRLLRLVLLFVGVAALGYVGALPYLVPVVAAALAQANAPVLPALLDAAASR